MTEELSKARSDAWDAALSEAQRWQAFGKLRGCPWYETAKWIAAEFAIEAPSRSALYRWAARMRRLESAHRIEQAIAARDEAGALASATGQSNAQRIAAYQALAQDVALRTGDAKTAGQFVAMAMQIAAADAKRTELDLRARAQATKDETLKLAQAKFAAAESRLAAVRDAVTTARQGGLTPETLAKIEAAAGLL